MVSVGEDWKVDLLVISPSLMLFASVGRRLSGSKLLSAPLLGPGPELTGFRDGYLASVPVDQVEDGVALGIPGHDLVEALALDLVEHGLQHVQLDWLLDEHDVVLRHDWRRTEQERNCPVGTPCYHAMLSRMHACTHGHKHTDTGTNAPALTHKHIHICTHTRTQALTHTHIQSHTHTSTLSHTHTHTHKHSHTHTH